MRRQEIEKLEPEKELDYEAFNKGREETLKGVKDGNYQVCTLNT